MSATHLSLHCHIVFSTKLRKACIHPSWKERLYSYMGGTLRGLGCVCEEIGGTSDHVHELVSFRANHRLSDVVRELKCSSSKWVHEAIGNPFFGWQDGYGAFSVGSSEIEAVRRYIRGQEEHHRVKSFQDEYLDLLRANDVLYDEEFLW